MSKPDIDWQLLKAFRAVLRQGTLSGAARELGLTQPTLGRQIAALEESLGVALFTRSPQGLSPTAAAAALAPHAEAMASAAETLARAASGAADPAKGTVRLTASVFMAGEVLPAMLADFQDRHRGIVVELLASNLVEDLLRRDADLAVRTTRPTQAALVAKRIGSVPVGLYARRDYLARRGMPKQLSDVADHVVIGFDRDDSVARGVAIAGLALTRDLFSFRTDNDLVQFAAIREGVGIGGCQIGIARRNPDLVRVLPEIVLIEFEVWLAMHEDLRWDRRVRLLFDHLAERLGDYIKECAVE